jgi:peptidoglycan/xylan/chitin deacetylase (PgdA/CDA1 family)
MLARNRLKRILGRVAQPVARWWRTAAAPVLCYHSVNPLACIHSVSPELFDAQLRYLMKHFHVLPLGDMIAEFRRGGPSEPSAAITFDDGYVDNHTYAFPILERHRCPATIFLPTAFIEREVTLIDEPAFAPLTWQQVKEMRASGVGFGAHSHTHRILSLLTRDEQKDEILRSKSIIEDHLGEEIDLFAYPNGQRPDFSTWTVNLLKEANFCGACSTIWGTRNTENEVFALRRIVVDHDDDMESFSLKVTGAYDYLGILHKMKGRMQFEEQG